MKDNEKRRWIALLRSQWRQRDEWEKDWNNSLMAHLADVLEQQWFPKGGRPKRSVFAETESRVENVRLARAVSEEMRKLKAKGHSGAKNAAIKTVAKRRGLGPEGLRRRLNGVDLDDPFYDDPFTGDGWGAAPPLMIIIGRARQITKVLNEADGNARREKFEAGERRASIEADEKRVSMVVKEGRVAISRK